MNLILKNGFVYENGEFLKKDLYVKNGDFSDTPPKEAEILDICGKYVFPGFCDVHVHFREPGFFYKETIKSGSHAAAKGGYTTVCTMPNLNPVPDNYENLKKQLDIIEKDACINVIPYGSITVKQEGEVLSDMESMKDYVCAFTDDGKGIQTEELMKKAMVIAKSMNKMIVAHCEDNSLLKGGYIHDGKYAKEHNHKGICSESEYGPIIRDIKLSKETGCGYHVCHISAKESVEAIREAKKAGVNITCETAPHYLVLDDSDLKEEGRFKMNPPLRDETDKIALVGGINDGTIDMIATDHAPHSEEEKSKGLSQSAFGITGIEIAFPVLYTKLVKTGKVTLEKIIELLGVNPYKRFGFSKKCDFSIWDLEEEFVVNPKEFLSKGHATPFENERLFGKCIRTVCNGKTVYKI